MSLGSQDSADCHLVVGDASSVVVVEVAFIVVRRRRCRRRRRRRDCDGGGGGDRENEGFLGGKWMDGLSIVRLAGGRYDGVEIGSRMPPRPRHGAGRGRDRKERKDILTD